MKKIIILLISILLLSTAWADREISGTIICNTLYIPGTTMGLEFELDFSSNDGEWIAYCELTFPAGMTPTETPPPITGYQYILEFNFISGQVCAWGAGLGDTSLGYLDVIGEPYVFTCTVEIDTGLSGSQDIEYYCGGDEYGSPPHEFSGTCIVDPALDHDLTGVSVTGNVIPSEGIESIYQITVYNQGNNPADTYTVELYLEGDILIGSVTGTTIDPGETLIYDIPWTPSSPGVTYLYGYINYAEDENTNNNTTPNFDVNVQSAGGFPISIGNGTDLSYQIPANFYYKSSLSQCWYYPEEINFGGNIMQIGYQTNWATDLQDMPMRIWMVATTQSQASIGWIPAGDMTLVFDGTIDLPPGYNHILFHLDTYFGYSCANNLVIMVQRPMDTQYYSYCDTWFCTFDISHPARTVHYYSDYVEMDPYAPSGGNIINYLPNLYLYFTGPQTRSLEGYVYENLIQGRDVIEGAYVEIEETTFGGTHTDDSGYYIFPGVFIENYNVTASAFGYYDETINVTIAEYGPNQQDFHLVRLPNVEVSGHVITSDTGEDVVGALVELEGYDFYETFTGGDGLFTIPGVYSGQTYTLTIFGYEGYDTYVDENVVVGETNLDLGDIIITELANPASGVYVEEDHNGFAEMTWRPPGSAPPGMEDFEDGEANDYLFNEPQYRWSVDDGYLKFAGQSLGSNGSAYWDNEVEDFTMEFEVQKNSGYGGYAQGAFYRADGFLGAASCNGYRLNITQNGSYCVIRYDNGGYTFIQGWITAVNLLTGFGVPNIVTIVAISDNFDIYFNGALEYSFTDATHSSGFCNVTAYDIQADEVWFDYVNIMQGARTVADISNFIPVTHNTVTGGDENKAPEKMNKFPSNSVEIRNLKLITESKISSINSTPIRERIIEGYDIYRLLDVEQEQPENWLEIVTGITDTTYIDESWAYLEISGFYRYAVIAVYTNDIYSNPAFSNIIDKDMYTEVTVNISTNSGDDPIGANVVLTCQDEDPAHIYTMTAPTPTDGVCFFQDVYTGVYNLEVNLTGFEAYLQENINIFDVITLPLELTEIIGVLGELIGDHMGGGEVFLIWTWAGVGNLLFVDDDGSAYLESTDTQPFYIDLFDEIGIDYSIHDIYEDFADGPAAAAMTAYDVVLWECGEQFSMGRTITANDEANLGTYIDGGGKVIISAYDYFYDIYPAAGDFSAGQFPYDYLGVASANQDANNLFFPDEIAINGTGGSYVDGLSVILTDIFSSRDGVYMDYLTSNAIGADYTLCDGNAVGIQTDNTIFTTAGYPCMIDGTDTVVQYLTESINNLFCARDREFLGFTISRDEAKIATDVMDMTYIDHVDVNETYEYTITANYTTGNSNTISTTVEVYEVSSPSNTIPVVTKLTGNYPNPFNPSGAGRSPMTNISFSISEASQVTIDIYNLKGEKVNTLVNEYLEPNYYNVEWNGTDENNRSVASGVYFYKMKAGDFQKVRKMILLK